MAKFSKITTTQNQTTTLGKLKFQHSIMMHKQDATRKTSELMNSALPFILFNAQNGSSTIIDSKIDSKYKDDNVEVVYGIFKLKVVHEPASELNTFNKMN
jgi:hypothetical protein